VRALETIHHSLRPDGLLLDVRPAPQHPWVVIYRGANHVDQTGRIVRVGQMDDSYRIETQVVADAAVQTMIAAGRFGRERAETFTVVYHFESVEAWLTYMADHWSSARISASLIEEARAELAREPGEVRVLRAIRAVRLRAVCDS
jgi:hypothetical protein